MMLPLEPRRTKNVPMMEVRMQVPAMASGNSIIAIFSASAKKIEASTMVATVVTA